MTVLGRMLAGLMLAAALARGQSTQGLITGAIRDSESGRPITNARVTWQHIETGVRGAGAAGPAGAYTLPALSPGTYTLTVSCAEYQSQEVHELTLAVAGTLDLDFRLRPLHDVWEQGEYRSVFLPGSGQILNFFGPDLDSTRTSTFQARQGNLGSLEATISDVIDPVLIRELPFAGRDIYAALVLMPGATSDSGTARGLGLVVNGQRPSSSNFYLDGVEATNYLTSGPAVTLPPEAVQEYRFSTNNYSAQYGGTTGFIANAVTRSGGDAFHGTLFGFVQNALLNANDFQRNASGWGRPSGKVNEFGFQVGGPILKGRRLFFTSAYDYYGSRNERSPITYRLLTGSFISTLPSSSVAYGLLSSHPSLASSVTGPLTADYALAAPVSVQRHTALERLDYGTADGRHRLGARVALAGVDRPDFAWSPYRGLNTKFQDSPISVALAHYFNINAGLVNEAKAGFSVDDLRWERNDETAPNLLAADAYLPGSPALYDYKNSTKVWQFTDNLIWTRGRHIVTTGVNYLDRTLSGYMTAGGVGEWTFLNYRDFGSDAPFLYRASRSYVSGTAKSIPNFYRDYRSRDLALFAQDTFRVTPRLVLNLGLRVGRFGSPVNSGASKDPGIELGSGSTLADRLRTATLDPSSTDPIYSSNFNWEPRAGVSYDLFGRGNTIVRGSFGIFHDRLPDTLWLTTRLNDLSVAQWSAFPPASVNYLAPIETVLRQFRPVGAVTPLFTVFEPELPASRSYNYFVGVQQRLTQGLSLEVNGLGAYGRDLLATDIINRSPTTPQSASIVNPALPFNIRYRGPIGFSDYNALTASLRYRSRIAEFRLNYTWSHSIDNQSNPLDVSVFDLTGVLNQQPTGFSQQFQSSADRGNSDFDQRHNLVFYSVWNVPARRWAGWRGHLLRNWRFAELAAFRTGFPFSMYGAGGGRVDVLDPARNYLDPAQPVTGGLLTLNRSNFTDAQAGSGRNSGRNAFRGPGLYNIDVSLSRVIPITESIRLVLRADAFNVLNHANLSNPGNLLFNTATFGISQYGRKGFDTGFPAATPFSETPRQIQLGVRVEF